MQDSARTKLWDYVVDLILLHIFFLSYWSKPQNIKKENHDQNYLSATHDPAGQMCEAQRAQSCGTAPGPSRPFQLAFCGSLVGQPLPNAHTHKHTHTYTHTHIHTHVYTNIDTNTQLHAQKHDCTRRIIHTHTPTSLCADEWIYSLHLDPPMTHQPFFEEHKQPQWWPSNYSMPPPYHCMPLQYQSMKKHEGSRAKQVVQSHSQHPLL